MIEALFGRSKPETSPGVHDICERSEAILRGRISDLEDKVEELLNKILTVSEEAMVRERALMDKVIATQNPGIARALMTAAAATQPRPEPTVAPAPPPRPPAVTPAMTGFGQPRVPLQRRARPSVAVAVVGSAAANAAIDAASAALAEAESASLSPSEESES